MSAAKNQVASFPAKTTRARYAEPRCNGFFSYCGGMDTIESGSVSATSSTLLRTEYEYEPWPCRPTWIHDHKAVEAGDSRPMQTTAGDWPIGEE